MHLFIGLFFLILVENGFSAPIIAKRDTFPEKAHLVKQTNRIRAEIAEKKQIANMQEVHWDTDLEKIAEGLRCDNYKNPGANYMILAYPAFFGNATEKKYVIEAMVNLDYHVNSIPGQSKIGCYLPDIVCPIPHTRTSIVSFCLVGPKTSRDDGDIKKGAPGSQCPNGKAANGLCKAYYV
ncbi:hypothetical protein GCK72_012117 [Caenorhabditis remanei]|uniref:SCP domain-containing protein n=1 Tax=Caenorhabditis remanei TaxID=31234 RepID=A0A6A5GK28_CAERE|nr:hypothetical protein GCK72_012117 [Caenorhabditis remanei]KAF1755667.1 hypothetical protein GCK72_012117 [Caenorhabditis remanei]